VSIGFLPLDGMRTSRRRFRWRGTRTLVRFRKHQPAPADIAHHERTWIEWAGGNLPFAYNQVVGWIRVESEQWAIKAYAHRTEQKRVQSGFKGRYQWLGKVLELHFIEETSDQIVDALRRGLLALTRKNEPFANRYVDLEAFDNLSPQLDWRDLLGLE
jgi:hypothetical protein